MGAPESWQSAGSLIRELEPQDKGLLQFAGAAANIALPYSAVRLDSATAVRVMGDRRMPSLCIRS